MSRLFIIGNGFDIAHGMKTSYWDFMLYLEKYDEEFLAELESVYGFRRYEPDGREPENISRKLIKNSRNYVFDCFWKNIEYELGYADEAEMESFSESIVNDMDMESGPVGIEDTLNYYWEEQYSFIKKLNDLIYKWAKQIRYFKSVPLSERLINNNSDLFLNFNYTNTLEKVYNIPNKRVLHIHGGLPPYCYIRPVLGHGNRAVIEKYRNMATEASESFDEGHTSIYNAIANLYERTYKDTSKYQQSLSWFLFKALENNIDTIEVIGHSLGDVDIPYFKNIIKILGADIKWIVYYHKEEEEQMFKSKLNDLDVKDDNLSILPSSDFFENL